MKIYFVRHGDPDYKHDCLTELGHKQAQAAAERLKNCGIERIYSSTNGRALMTADYTAKLLGLEVIRCDFMREIGWKSIDGEPIPGNGNPWLVSSLFVSEGKSLTDRDWTLAEPFCQSIVVDTVRHAYSEFDALLAEYGYRREGDYYRVTGENTDRTIAVFSHGGSSSAVLSHLLNIPFPQFCGSFRMGCSSVITVTLANKIGELCQASLGLFNDMKHTEGLAAEVKEYKYER